MANLGLSVPDAAPPCDAPLTPAQRAERVVQEVHSDALFNVVTDQTWLRRIEQEIASAIEPTWDCGSGGSVGANDPQDCDWPSCGCDPYANRVIDRLRDSDPRDALIREFISIEEGWLSVRGMESPNDLIDRKRAALASARRLVAEGE